MDFHADDNLPVAGRALDQFLSTGLSVHVIARVPLKNPVKRQFYIW
jgi:hypothetical protein